METHLCRVDIARSPSHVGPQVDERLNEDGRLGVDVCTAHDVGPLQRFVLEGLLPQGHDAGHLLFGDFDLMPAERVLLDVPDAEIGEPLGVLLDLVPRGQIVLLGGALGVRTWARREKTKLVR